MAGRSTLLASVLVAHELDLVWPVACTCTRIAKEPPEWNVGAVDSFFGDPRQHLRHINPADATRTGDRRAYGSPTARCVCCTCAVNRWTDTWDCGFVAGFAQWFKEFAPSTLPNLFLFPAHQVVHVATERASLLVVVGSSG